jgi:putative protease
MKDLGIETVYADFQDIREYREACRWSKANGIRIWLASPRIEKPGEFNLFRYLEKCQPEGILVRNAGGVEFCRSSEIPWIADFSLNITNAATAQLIRQLGAQKLTAGFDLNISQLMELVDSAPASWFEVVVHQRVAMFHMEHCVFCMVLTPGTDKSNCGRPCDRHTVHLEDRVGVQHRLTADVGCRNTLFHAQAQSAAEFMPRLKEKQVASLRLEFVDESPELVQEVVRNYQAAMTGTIDPRTLWRRVRATNQYGLTRGTLQIVS